MKITHGSAPLPRPGLLGVVAGGIDVGDARGELVAWDQAVFVAVS